MAQDQERDTGIIVEFIEMGPSVKVSAIDVASGEEVSIIGPATATQAQLEQIAVAKLKYVMSKRSGKNGGPGVVV